MHTLLFNPSQNVEAGKSLRRKCAFLFFLLILVSATQSFGAARFAVASGNWNGAIWATTAGGVAGSAATPVAADAVTINATRVVNVNVAAAATSVVINGTLNFNSGVDLTLANAGSLTVNSGGALVFDANGQVVGGANNANGILVTINTGATLTTANSVGFMAGASNAVVTGSFAINRGNRGGPTYSAGVDYVYNSATAQNIGTGPATMADLTITNSGVVTATASYTASGVVTVDNGATLSLGANTLTLSGAGTPFVNNGTLAPGTGTVAYSSGAAQNIAGTTYYNLTFSAAGAKTFPAGSNTSIGNNWATGTAAVSMNTTANVSVTATVSGTAAITMGSGTLTLGGTGAAFGNTGTFNRGTGTVVYNRAGTQTVRQTTYNNLTLAGTSAKTTTTVTVAGILSMEGTATATAAPTYGAAAQLVYNTATARTAGVEWLATFAATGGVVIDNTGAITMGANKTFGANASLTINSGATLTTGNFDLLLNANFINNGTWTTSTGDVTVTGTAGQSIGSFSTTGALIATKSGGTATLTGDVNMGTLTMSTAGGTVNLGTGLNHNASGVVTLTNGTLNGGSSTLSVSAVSATTWGGTNGTFVANNSTIRFNAAGNQTLSATGTNAKVFYNLTFSGSGTRTNATTTVNNIFSLEGTSVPSAAPTYGANATLQYNTATGRTAGAEWLATFTASGGVVVDNTGTITLNANKTLGANAPFNIKTGATFNAGNFDMVFNNDFTNDGTWTASAGNVTLQGTGAQSIAGFTTTGVFTMGKTGGVATLTSNVNAGGFTLNGVGGTLSFGTGLTHTFSGTYNSVNGAVYANNSTMNLDGGLTATGGTFDAGTGTVAFRGNTPQTVLAVNWYNLVFSGTGLKTFSGNSNVFNNITVNSGATIDLQGTLLQLGGPGTPFVNNGTVLVGTSTISYLGAAPETIIPLNYYNLTSTGGDRIFSTSGNIGISGAFTPGTGNFTVAGSTVDFNGGSNQLIPSFTFDKLIVSNNGIKKILAAIIVACQTIDINDNASVEIDADNNGKLNVMNM